MDRTPAVEIRPRALSDRLFIKMWRPGEHDIDKFAAALGFDLPRQIMTFAPCGDRRVYSVAPGDWVFEGVLPLAELEIRLATLSVVWSAVDITAGRRSVTIAGPAASDLINCGCSLDLHPRAFPIGRCADTLLAQIHILIARTGDDAFDLTFDQSVEGHVRSWLADAVLEFQR